MGKGRTPFQCLARYQRSLNSYILKSGWTEDEDAQLRELVKVFGENDWQTIANAIGGRAGVQCSNRWRKSLHPSRQKVGKWSADESLKLKICVMLFGPKSWNKIADFIPGRTQVQCRERWFNCLDPSVNLGRWTEEDDSKLKAAFAEHGHCWSKIASCVPGRTDSQCSRRWKVLFPDEVPLLQAARKIKKIAFISNFVDREEQRPALSTSDFVSASVEINSTLKKSNGRKTNRLKRSCNEPQPKSSKKKAKGESISVRPSQKMEDDVACLDANSAGKDISQVSKIKKPNRKRRKFAEKEITEEFDDGMTLASAFCEIKKKRKVKRNRTEIVPEQAGHCVTLAEASNAILCRESTS